MARWALPAPDTVRPARSSSGWRASEPETVDPVVAKARVEEINAGGKLQLAGTHTIQFDHTAEIVLVVARHGLSQQRDGVLGLRWLR